MNWRPPMPPGEVALLWLLSAIACMLAFLMAARGDELIKYSERLDNRPLLVRLVRSVSPMAEVGSRNAAARLKIASLDVRGADSSPGRISWVPERWALSLTFQAEFFSFCEP